MKSLLLSVSLAALLAVGCSGKGTPTEGGTDKPKPLGKPEFTLTSVKFGEEFKGDSKQAARKKYENKVIELTGEVKSIALAPDRAAMLWLEGAKGELLGVL
jgi:hypothetical protein